jgi:hypothetical protein
MLIISQQSFQRGIKPGIIGFSSLIPDWNGGIGVINNKRPIQEAWHESLGGLVALDHSPGDKQSWMAEIQGGT